VLIKYWNYSSYYFINIEAVFVSLLIIVVLSLLSYVEAIFHITLLNTEAGFVSYSNFFISLLNTEANFYITPMNTKVVLH
jgi:hypothetical protein